MVVSKPVSNRVGNSLCILAAGIDNGLLYAKCYLSLLGCVPFAQKHSQSKVFRGNLRLRILCRVWKVFLHRTEGSHFRLPEHPSPFDSFFSH